MLAPEGRVYIAVPNAESIHRHIGVSMGIISSLDKLSENDIAVGHRRVFTWKSLERVIHSAGFIIESKEGILIKPLPSKVIDTWDEELVEAFLSAHSLAPRLCSEIFFVCKGI